MYKEYITTNIRMPKNLWVALKKRALHEGKSLAELLREGAIFILNKEKSSNAISKSDPFLKIIGKGRGQKNGSAKHDKALYDNKDFC